VARLRGDARSTSVSKPTLVWCDGAVGVAGAPRPRGSVRLACLCVAAVVAVSGCGSSAADRSHSSTAAAAPRIAPASAATSQQELDAYLVKVGDLRRRGNAAYARTYQLLQKVHSSAQPTWDRAAASCRRTAGVIRGIATGMRAISPPAPLLSVHRAYADVWHVDVVTLVHLARLLNRGAGGALIIIRAPSAADQPALSRYRTAIAHYAGARGLTLPHWLTRPGDQL
jgi:hypothetical protein